MGFSINSFTFDGGTEFDLNFTLGYTSRDDIDCYVDSDTPVNVEFDWISDNRVRIVPTNVTVGDKLDFVRTVSKTALPVDLTAPGRLTRENVETSVLHNLYAMHEVLDGRIGDFGTISEVVKQTAEEIVTQALEDTDLVSSNRYPIIVHGSASGIIVFPAPATIYSHVDEVVVTLTDAPAVPVRFTMVNNGVDILFIDVYPDGTTEVQTAAGRAEEFTITKGVLELIAVDSNYFNGEIAVGMNGLDDNIISTSGGFADFLTVYTEARDTV